MGPWVGTRTTPRDLFGIWTVRGQKQKRRGVFFRVGFDLDGPLIVTPLGLKSNGIRSVTTEACPADFPAA